MKTHRSSGKRSSILTSIVMLALGASLCADSIPVVDSQYSIQNWMVDDGLPRNSITSVTQSPNGFIWLGTRFSVIRFDGVEFKEFGLEPGDQIEDVRGLAFNGREELYLAMGNQALKKYANGHFSNLTSANGSHVDFHDVATGPDNTVWAIDGQGVLYKVIGEKFVQMAILEANFEHSILFDIHLSQDGTVWFSRGEFFGCFRTGQNPKIWRLESQFTRLSIAADGEVYILTGRELRQLLDTDSGKSRRIFEFPEHIGWGSSLLADSQNRIWIGSKFRGLLLWENGQLKQFTTFPSKFWSIFEDKEGSIWISFTGHGLYQIRDKSLKIIRNPEFPEDSYTTSAHKNFLISNDPGIHKLSGDNQFEPVDIAGKRAYSVVWAETAASFWTGDNNGRIFRFHENRVSEFQINTNNQPIRLLFMDSEKTIWAGGYDWGLSRLPYPYTSTETILSDNGNRQFFKSLAEMPNGVIYAGSRNGDIYSIDGETTRRYSRESGLMGSSIQSLICTSTGRLLAGTSGHGLAILENGRFRYISTKQGLHDPVVSQMVEDDAGFIWIGSTRGIFRVELSDIEAWLSGRKEAVTSMVFGKAHGLSNVEVISDHQPGASLADDSIIEFATNIGLIRIDPKEINTVYNAPKAVIDSVQIDENDVPTNNTIRVQTGFQRIAFNFTAASFASPKSIHYRCSLEGIDSSWINLGKERSIRYARLPPGNYLFKVSASDQNGEWSEGYASVPLLVVPRWWETKFTRAAFLVLFTLTIIIIVRAILVRRMQIAVERARQEMLLERERTRISKDLHDDLGARLTEIAFMADLVPRDEESRPAVESAWDKIAIRARKAVESLDETVWMIDPGKDVLHQFVPYIVQYTTEFCERSDLACRFDIPESLPSVRLLGRTRHHLFLAFKEALNNVVRHAGANLVKVMVSCESSVLKICVADNGSGMDLEKAESGQRQGIGNMRDRMKRIDANFDIQSDPGNGTVITFKLDFRER